MTTLEKILSSCAVAVLATLGLAAPANAEAQTSSMEIAETSGPDLSAQCPTTLEPTIPGGAAKWTLECVSNGVKVYGWVEDTRADGQCARVDFATADGQTDWSIACGWGDRTTFSTTFQDTRQVEGRLLLP